jgi:DNA recombination protein RmuC
LENIILGCCLLTLLLLLLLLWRSLRPAANLEIQQELADLRRQLTLLEQTTARQGSAMAQQAARQNETIISTVSHLGGGLRDEQEKQRRALTEQLEGLRRDNQASLDRINQTVDEKLQKTLERRISQSFEAVNQRLAEVYAGLGEMKSVAAGVADLKKVLANVKTRGTLGEIQLGAILQEVLAPEQYGEQLRLTPDSAERVDFAVRLPGQQHSEPVYLPIDAKFPADVYANLLAAYENGDAAELKERRAALELTVKKCAKSIADKYIKPPYTTDFAIMFLPCEGLYAEVVNLGLLENLQRSFKVSVAGPSTMAAMLNSLQMGFRTLAIQQKSGEVWQILEAAKKEFESFENVLDAVRKRLRQADDELDKLVGVRTRAINRRLLSVEVLDEAANE